MAKNSKPPSDDGKPHVTTSSVPLPTVTVARAAISLQTYEFRLQQLVRTQQPLITEDRSMVPAGSVGLIDSRGRLGDLVVYVVQFSIAGMAEFAFAKQEELDAYVE